MNGSAKMTAIKYNGVDLSKMYFNTELVFDKNGGGGPPLVGMLYNPDLAFVTDPDIYGWVGDTPNFIMATDGGPNEIEVQSRNAVSTLDCQTETVYGNITTIGETYRYEIHVDRFTTEADPLSSWKLRSPDDVDKARHRGNGVFHSFKRMADVFINDYPKMEIVENTAMFITFFEMYPHEGSVMANSFFDENISGWLLTTDTSELVWAAHPNKVGRGMIQCSSSQAEESILYAGPLVFEEGRTYIFEVEFLVTYSTQATMVIAYDDVGGGSDEVLIESEQSDRCHQFEYTVATGVEVAPNLVLKRNGNSTLDTQLLSFSAYVLPL